VKIVIGPLASLSLVVVDVETTGWAPDQAEITEIGAVRLTGGHLTGEFSSLVRTARPIPADITALTGITDDMVRRAPLAGPALRAHHPNLFKAALGGRPAHRRISGRCGGSGNTCRPENARCDGQRVGPLRPIFATRSVLLRCSLNLHSDIERETAILHQTLSAVEPSKQ
jgi:hypothetical protein